MENTEGRQYFGVGLDLDGLRKSSDEAIDLLGKIGQEAVRQGNIFDKGLSAVSSGNMFNSLNAALEGASSQLGTMASGLPVERFRELALQISVNESEVAKMTAALEDLRAQAETAFNAGDTEQVATLSAQMDVLSAKISATTETTTTYKNALEALKYSMGIAVGTDSSPMFFKSEKDIAEVNALRDKIAELKATMAELQSQSGDSAETKALAQNLTEAQVKLTGLESGAKSAAAALGDDLGARASEAQQRVIILNEAVEKQAGILETIRAQLAAATEHYQQLAADNTSSTEAIEAAGASVAELTRTLADADAQYQRLTSAQQQAQSEMAAVNGEIRTHDSIFVKMLGGYDRYNEILGSLPAPVQSVVGGIMNMTKAAKLFIATPLGMILGAIALALKTVWEWLNSSVEGQKALATISGYVSGVLGQLKEIVFAVGEALFKAFSDPKKAISDLWEAIKTNLVNRIEGMGGVFKSLGKIIRATLSFDWDEAKTGLKELGENVSKTVTGVENLAQKTAGMFKNMNDKAKENAAIEREALDLEIKKSEWKVKEQELLRKEAEASGKLRNSSLSTAERRKAQEEYNKAVKERFDMEQEFAKKDVELQERKMALTTNAIADENKLRDLKAKSAEVETNRARALARLERYDGTINNKEESESQKAQKRLQAQRKLNAELAEMERENEAERIAMMKDGLQKRLLEIENAYTQQVNAIRKQRSQWEKENKEAGLGPALSKEQESTLLIATQNAEAKRLKAITDTYRAEFDAQDESLIRFGSYNEQRLAIAEKYGRLIADATSQQNRQKLERERDDQLRAVHDQELKERIDWGVVFGDFGDMFRAVLEPALKDVRAYMQTDEFRNAPADQQKTVFDAVRQMEDAIGVVKPESFAHLNEQIQQYTTLMGELQAAQQQEKKDFETLSLARRNYEAALKTGSQSQITAAKNALDSAQTQYDATKVTADGLRMEGENLKRGISDTATALQTSINKVVGGLSGLASGSLEGKLKGVKNFAEGVAGLEKAPAALKAVFSKIADTVKNIPFLGIIMQLLDVLKDGIGTLIAGLIEGVLGAISGVLDNILSGKFFEQIINAILEGIGNIFNSIIGNLGSMLSFGLLSSDMGSWFTNGNGKAVAETTERLTHQNEGLQKSIDALKDSIDKAYGGAAIKSYQEAVENQRKYIENMRQILDVQQGYHGAHHSNIYYWDMDESSTDAVNRLLGKNLRADVWDDWSRLTADEMAKIREWLPSVWSEMLAQGKYDKSEYFEQYADQAGKIEELTEQIRQNLLDVSFEGLRDRFVDDLMDMTKDAQGFADDLTEMLQRSFLRAEISNSFDARIKSWYESITDAMQGADGSYRELTQSQIDEYRRQWDEMAAQMIAERDRIAAITGYDSTEANREASQKGIATASQDSVDELNGRATAIQSHTFSISENTKLLLSTTNQILRSVMNIENETTGLGSRIERMEGEIKEMADTIGDIYTKGLILRT